MASLNHQLIETIPHLQRYAWHLARNRDEADDLVQDCIERALRKSDLFERGTNLRAWMFTMMRNIFINGKRRQGVADNYLSGVRADSRQVQNPSQLDSAMLSRTYEALESLSGEEREAVVLLGIEQRSYREVADETGLPIGTMKSRLSRGRAKLRHSLMRDDVTAEAPSVA
jgi:RNA polymerase sigma-70 factor (ECF subfamily)